MNLFILNKKDYLIGLSFFLLGTLSRLPLIERMQSHWDGSLFAIAVTNYSIAENTPPRPGHPLYIAFGKLFNTVIDDPHTAILLVSVLFTGLSAVAFYIAGKSIFNRSVGVIAASIFLSGSTFYYFGLTPYSFAMLPFSWCLLGAAIYLYLFRKWKTAPFIGIIFAFALGVRPQEILFITPLFLYVFILMKGKDRLTASIYFLLTFLLWFIPLLVAEGGLRYFFVATSNPPPYTIGFKQQDMELIIKDYFLSLGLAGLVLPVFVFLKRNQINKNKRIISFFVVWMTPSLIYNFFITSVHAGYQMDYLIALVLISSYAIYNFTKRKKGLIFTSVVVIVVFNLFIFFFDRDPSYTKPYRPTSFHYSDIRKNDLKMSSKVNFIRKRYDPDKTIVITVSTLWSPYMYHLKNYRQYSIEALYTKDSRFSDQRRDSFMWKVNEYETKKRSFMVPKNVNKILLVDDEINFNIINLKKYEHILPGNSSVIEIEAKYNQEIEYGYHYLKRI